MLYKALVLCNSHLKQLYLSNKTVCFSYKGGCDLCKRKHNVALSNVFYVNPLFPTLFTAKKASQLQGMFVFCYDVKFCIVLYDY